MTSNPSGDHGHMHSSPLQTMLFHVIPYPKPDHSAHLIKGWIQTRCLYITDRHIQVLATVDPPKKCLESFISLI